MSDVYFPQKAYKNLPFLNSSSARPIRILCEYEEPRQRLHDEGIEDTVVFYGSARIRDAATLAEARTAAVEAGDTDRAAALDRVGRLSRYYDDARELSRRLTEWNQTHPQRDYIVVTGGGPGIMEAANRGAADVPGGRSVGLGVSLPFEQGTNRWVPPELGFEFHYFFTRKFWFLYQAKALVVFPGGFGTLDELFESLTLVQTRKLNKRIPTLLFGKEYWDRIVDLEAMAEFGTISPADPSMVYKTDDVDDAFAWIVRELQDQEAHGRIKNG